ncbi:MAG: hypothetical protein ACK55Z_26110, partial [bacterium]
MGVQSPQLVRLLGEGLRVLVVHLGEQDPNLPGQPAQEKAGEEMRLLLTPGADLQHLGHELGRLPGPQGRQLE